MSQNRATGDRAFRRELDEQDTRLTKVEESGGGGGGEVTYEGGGNEATNPKVIEIGDGLTFNPRPEDRILIERGSGVLDRFSVDNQIGFAKDEDGTIGELLFLLPENQAANKIVIQIHVFLSLVAEEEVAFGAGGLGLALFDDEDEKVQDLMYAAPVLQGGEVITPVILDFLIQPDKFYPGVSAGELEGREGALWRVRPFVAGSPGDFLVNVDSADAAGVAASFGVAHIL